MTDKKCTAEQLKQMFLDDGRTNVSVVKADPIEEAIKNYYGERCPDYDADCVVCQAWEQRDFLKFEGYSIVKSPTGISIKPNNGDTYTEVCLRVENGNLLVTLYAYDNDWCGPDHIIDEIQYSI